MKFDTTQQLVDSFRHGNMVVLLDDDDENLGGVLLAPAEDITAEKVNFMARQARGLICLSLTAARCAQLRLPLMVESASRSVYARRFPVSIEAADVNADGKTDIVLGLSNYPELVPANWLTEHPAMQGRDGKAPSVMYLINTH